MKIIAPLAVVALLFATQVSAQTAASSSFKPAPPPPSMSDPGVKATPEPAAQSAAAQPVSTPVSTPAEMSPTRMPGKPIPLPRQPGDKGPAQALPDVKVRQQGDSTVEEYRQAGRLYMVVVTPKKGVPQTYMVDDDGRLRGSDGQAPVRPVMYKVFEWGKSPPAPDRQAAPAGDSGN
jgi:hypothetical protein